jgi:photosystem II stability/assembly factor-like uncharacterized protein
VLGGSLQAGAPPPASQYEWHDVVIGGGGFVTGLIAHPRAPNLIYARTDVGGAYRWDENAHRWIPITDSFGDEDFTGIESLALDPNDTNRVYLAAGIYESTRAAIFRSSDQGRTWQRTEVPFKMGGNETGRFNGERLVVNPANGKNLFFGSRRDGLWQSMDSGETWNRVDNFPKIPPDDGPPGTRRRFWNRPVGIVCVLFDGPVIYAAVSTTTTNFFCSMDAGVSWQAVSGQPSDLRPNHVVSASDGTLYLSYGREPGPNAMTDGALWKFDPRTKHWTDITPLRSPEDGQTFGYGAVALDAQNPSVVLVSTFCRWKQHDELFRSTNAGVAWIPVFKNAHWDVSSAPYAGTIKPHWMGSIAISPFDGNRAWFTTGYGIWNCDNLTAADAGSPVHWSFSDNGLDETVPLALTSPPSGAHLLSGVGDIDGFLHENLDLAPARGSFAGPHFNNTEDIAFASGNPKIVVRTGTGGEPVHMAISDDGGKTWKLLATEPEGASGGGVTTISADGRTIVWTTRGQVPCVTTDRGATWNQCAGLSAGIRVVADAQNSARFYTYDPRGGKFFTSTNGAASFVVTAAVFPVPTGLRSGFGFDIPSGADISVTPGREGDLWLAFKNNGLLHSTDGGQSFVRLENVIASPAFGFGRPPAGKDFPALFLFGKIGTQQGVFRSDDVGQNWIRVNDDEHQFGWITKLTGDPRVFGRVYLATSGRGTVYGDDLSPRLAATRN